MTIELSSNDALNRFLLDHYALERASKDGGFDNYDAAKNALAEAKKLGPLSMDEAKRQAKQFDEFLELLKHNEGAPFLAEPYGLQGGPIKKPFLSYEEPEFDRAPNLKIITSPIVSCRPNQNRFFLADDEYPISFPMNELIQYIPALLLKERRRTFYVGEHDISELLGKEKYQSFLDTINSEHF